MKETFNQFLSRSYVPLSKHLNEQLNKEDSKNKKLSKSFLWKIIMGLCLLIILASISIVLMLSFFEKSDKIEILKWVTVAILIIANLFCGISFTFSRKAEVIEKSRNLAKINLNNSLNYLFKLLNFEYKNEEKNNNIPWINYCKNLTTNGENSKVKILRKALLNSEIGQNNTWKIQEVTFESNDKNETFLLIEGSHKNMTENSYISCGSKNEIYDYLKKKNKVKFIHQIDQIHFKTSSKETYELTDTIKTFEEFKLNEKDYGFLIDPKNKVSCSWIKIENKFLNIQNSSNPVKTILNHLYLIYVLTEIVKQFTK